MNLLQVASGVDIAQGLQDAPSINSETCSLASTMSLNSYSSKHAGISALSEDEALRLILAKYKTEVEQATVADLSDAEVGSAEIAVPVSSTDESATEANDSPLSESQERKSDELLVSDTEVLPENPKSTESSYNALIESYNMLGGSYTRTPDLQSVLERFGENNAIKHPPNDVSFLCLFQ